MKEHTSKIALFSFLGILFSWIGYMIYANGGGISLRLFSDFGSIGVLLILVTVPLIFSRPILQYPTEMLHKASTILLGCVTGGFIVLWLLERDSGLLFTVPAIIFGGLFILYIASFKFSSPETTEFGAAFAYNAISVYILLSTLVFMALTFEGEDGFGGGILLLVAYFLAGLSLLGATYLFVKGWIKSR